MADKTFADFNIEVGPWEHGDRKKKCPKCQDGRSREHQHDRPLWVNVEKGVWKCFHCDWTGSLGLDLLDWRERVSVTPVYAKPPIEENAALEQWGLAWLAERGISEATAAAQGVYTTTRHFGEEMQRAIVFPYTKDGVIVNHKYRGPQKAFQTDPGSERVFYNFDVLKEATDLYIVEGEMDVLAFLEAGITEVVSVPNGGTERSMPYLESAMPYLKKMATITLAGDGDSVGDKLSEELARRLGRERCKQIKWPGECKDANDVLMQHGKDALRLAVAEAHYYPVGGSVHFSDLREELYKSFHFKPTRGYLTGWPAMDKHYTVRPGELTIVTGIPSSGKSEWLASLLVNLVKQHSFAFSIFSAENYDDTPAPLAEQLVRKWVGKPFKAGYEGRMAWGDVESAIGIFDEHFAFINPEEPTLDSILDTAKVHLTRLGIKGLVIDPWNEVSHNRSGLSETDYIGEALRRIRKFARMHEIHVWVVAHPTKMLKTTMDDGTVAFEVPTAYSISGCYSDDTEVLTHQGWKRHQDLDQTEHVACFDPTTGTLRYERPEQYHEYDFDGEMYRFKGESLDMLVTPNHRMLIRAAWPHTPKNVDDPRIQSRDWRFVHAEDLVKSHYEIPYSAPLENNREDNTGFAIEQKHVVGPGRVYEKYQGDELLQYLGWWIAEGCVQSSGLSICQAVGPTQEKIKACMDALSLDYTDKITQGTRPDKDKQPMWVARIKARSHPALTSYVRNKCGEGAANKHLPDMVWRLSDRQKRVLFDALIEGDGSVRPNGGGYQYATTSRQLADDVMRLAIELGMPASISEQGRAQSHHKNRYIVFIGRVRPTLSLRTIKHLTKEAYSGKVYCLTVPTGAYLTRRNGKMAICGNSANWFNKADNIICVYRFLHNNSLPVQVHVQKIRKQPDVGTPGIVQFTYDWRTSSYTDIPNPDEVDEFALGGFQPVEDVTNEHDFADAADD